MTQSSGTFCAPVEGWPAPSKVNEYVADRRRKILESLPSVPYYLLDMSIEHELMHQETLLYMMLQLDTKYIQIGKNIRVSDYSQTRTEEPKRHWVPIEGAEVRLGVSFDGFGTTLVSNLFRVCR